MATHVKLQTPDGRHVDTLIVNGAEGESYLTTDHRVMLEQRDDIFMGIRYVQNAADAAYGPSRLRSPGELSLRSLSDLRSPLVRPLPMPFGPPVTGVVTP